MTLWVVLPVKPAAQAKQRLSPLLDARQRAAIAETMLRGVLDCLQELPTLRGRVLLLGSDEGVAGLAREYGVEFLAEPGDIGLNAALELARASLLERGASSMLIMHADLPLIDAATLQQLLTQHAGFDAAAKISLVPDRHGVGTNCLLSTPVAAVSMCFGGESRRAFTAAAARQGLACQALALPALQFDIDEPTDIHELLAAAPLPGQFGSIRSVELLRSFGLDDNTGGEEAG